MKSKISYKSTKATIWAWSLISQLKMWSKWSSKVRKNKVILALYLDLKIYFIYTIYSYHMKKITHLNLCCIRVWKSPYTLSLCIYLLAAFKPFVVTSLTDVLISHSWLLISGRVCDDVQFNCRVFLSIDCPFHISRCDFLYKVFVKIV